MAGVRSMLDHCSSKTKNPGLYFHRLPRVKAQQFAADQPARTSTRHPKPCLFPFSYTLFPPSFFSCPFLPFFTFSFHPFSRPLFSLLSSPIPHRTPSKPSILSTTLPSTPTHSPTGAHNCNPSGCAKTSANLR